MHNVETGRRWYQSYLDFEKNPKKKLINESVPSSSSSCLV